MSFKRKYNKKTVSNYQGRLYSAQHDNIC